MIVRPLHGFGAPTAIRVSVGTPEENEFFAAALGRVLPEPSSRLRSLRRSTRSRRCGSAAGARCFADGRFRLLFFATLGSGIGNWLAVVALQVDVYDRTHSGWWVAALLVANILPAVFLGLLLGPLVDRLSRKRLMIASDLGRLAVFAALPFAQLGRPAIVALAAVAGIGNAFFRPGGARGAPEPRPRGASSPSANGCSSSSSGSAIAVGPLLGGVLTAASGPDLAYWVNAATFAFSAAARRRGSRRGCCSSDRPIGRGHWTDLAEGFAVVRSSRALLCVLDRLVDRRCSRAAAMNVAEVFLAKESLRRRRLRLRAALGRLRGRPRASAGSPRRALIAQGLARAYVRLLLVFAVGIAAAAAAPERLGRRASR